MNSVKTEQMLDEIADELYQRGYADSDIWLDDHKGPYRASVGKIIEKAFEESRKEISALREAVKVMREAFIAIGRGLSGEINENNYTHDDICYLNKDYCRILNISAEAENTVSKLLPEPGKPEVK